MSPFEPCHGAAGPDVLPGPGDVVLDPLTCLALKGKKYQAETEEVYLANKGGTILSASFRNFLTLEVCWFNDNKLTRLDNLDTCFRIRELYVQNNRLVSLQFLQQFKFLRTLLASNNQIRNLDKQLRFLSKLNFLKKCDLFDNSIAEEPDYRLRMIYHAPQVQILDRVGVKLEDRQRAEQIVPNMDSAAPPQIVKAIKKAYTFTGMEQDCFRLARTIRNERQRVEDASMRTQVFKRSDDIELNPQTFQVCRNLRENQLRWSDPSRIVEHEAKNLTAWEKQWKDTSCDTHLSMQGQIEQMAGKEELNKEDVLELSSKLHQEGLDDAGRMLIARNVFVGAARKKGDWDAKLEALEQDPEATMTAKDVAAYLLTLQWTNLSNEAIDRKVGEHNKLTKLVCKRSTFGTTAEDTKYGEEGDAELLCFLRDKTARLEGLKTKKSDIGLVPKPDATVLRKSRSDVFSQSYLRPQRGIDELTGRTVVRIAPSSSMTRICG